MSLLTMAGFAFPCVAFITCPTSDLAAAAFPAFQSAIAFGLAAMTWSTIAASAPVSATCVRP